MSDGNGNGNGNGGPGPRPRSGVGSGEGRPFRDDVCLAIMAIPGYSLTDCAVLLWVAKRTLWGKAICTALPSRIARELGGKIAIRTIQCSLRRFEDNGLTLRASVKSGPYPNRETTLTEQFWETIQSVLACIEPRRYRSTSTQFSAPYSRTAHGDAPTSTQFCAAYARTAHGDARFAHGDARFAHGDARSAAPHIEERARSEFSITSLTTTTGASSSSSSFLAALENESGGTGGLNGCATPAPAESNPDPPCPPELVARVRGLWPEEPLIERRLGELAAQGEAEAALAVEYAAARKAKGLAYAFSTRKRWVRDGYTLAECQAEVRAGSPRTPPPPLLGARPTAAGNQPVMQNLTCAGADRTGRRSGHDRGHPVGWVAELGEGRSMIPLDRLVREPSDLAVAASFRRLNQAIQSGDQAQIDLVLAEIDHIVGRGAGCVEREDDSTPHAPRPRPTLRKVSWVTVHHECRQCKHNQQPSSPCLGTGTSPGPCSATSCGRPSWSCSPPVSG